MSILPPDPVYCLKSDMGFIHCLCFPKKLTDHYSSQLLAGTEKGLVYFWDLETNRQQHKLEVGESIQALHAFDFDIITQEKNGLVKLWAIEDNSGYKIQKSFQCYGGYCKSAVVNNQIILPKDNSSIEIIDIHNFEKVKQIVPETVENERLGNVMCLEVFVLKNNTYILVGYESGHITLYDYNTAKQCSQLKLKECTMSLTFDPFTCRGVCGNSSNTLQVFAIDRTTLEISLKCEINIPNAGCNVVKLRDDKKMFVSGGWDGRIRVFSWKTLRQLVFLSEHKKSITDVQFSPNTVRLWESNIFAASGEDGMISLWNLYNNYN